MPSRERIEEYKQAVAAKYPLCPDVAFAADGCKLAIEVASNDDSEQRMFYNGWTHGHYVSCIFVFAPDGTIPMCAVNAPGCMHDSMVASYGGIYGKLESAFNEHGVKTVVDSAFSLGSLEAPPFL